MRDMSRVRGYKSGILARDVGGSAHVETQSGKRAPNGLYGSLPVENVYGGARREGFPVTPTKTPVSFRFDNTPNEIRA